MVIWRRKRRVEEKKFEEMTPFPARVTKKQ